MGSPTLRKRRQTHWCAAHFTKEKCPIAIPIEFTYCARHGRLGLATKTKEARP